MRLKRLTLTIIALSMVAGGGCPTTTPDEDPGTAGTGADPSAGDDPALDGQSDLDDGASGLSDAGLPAEFDGGWSVSASTLGACFVVSGGAITAVNNSCGASLSRLEVDQVVAVRNEQNNAAANVQIQRVRDEAVVSGLSPEAVAEQINAINEGHRQANFLNALDAHLSNAESRLLIGPTELNSLVSAIESAALGRSDFLAAARSRLDTSTVRVFLSSSGNGAESDGDEVVWVVQFRFPGGGTGAMTFNLRRLSDSFLQGEVDAGISTVAVSMFRQ